MSRKTAHPPRAPLPEHVAEAAAWVAHLHGDKRTADSDRGLNLWLRENPARARVWEVTTEVWEEVGALQGAAIAQALMARRDARKLHRRRRLYAWAAAVCIALAGIGFLVRDPRLETNIGEQRTVTLQDGTRVFLNTDTRLVVRYREHERRVKFERGEALFEVASHAGRPFVVEVDDRRILALGTAFLVRKDPGRTEVTLTQGKVSVGIGSSATGFTVLSPGERITFPDSASPQMSRPELDKATAWLRGRVILEGTPLSEAISEMNRYNATRLSYAGPRAAQLRVSGVFRCGDSLSFARAVAATYGLRVVEERNRIHLLGEPQEAYRTGE